MTHTICYDAPPRIVFVGPNSGGVGKTLVSCHFDLWWCLEGRKPYLVDGDLSNRGLTKRLGANRVDALSTLTDLEGVSALLIQRAREFGLVVVDLGANALVMGGLFDLLADTIASGAAAGIEVCLVACVTENKPGLADDVRRWFTAADPRADRIIIENAAQGADGFGAFRSIEATRLQFPAIPAAILGEVYARTPLPLIDLVDRPPANLILASAIMLYFADRFFTGSPSAQGFFRLTEGAVARLEPYRFLPISFYSHSLTRSAADDVLTAENASIGAYRALEALQHASPADRKVARLDAWLTSRADLRRAYAQARPPALSQSAAQTEGATNARP